MAQYTFTEIEKHWQDEWRRQNIYHVTEDPTRPKYYVLDMFPYPSGAGLHVGHPLGYIASDIVARFKRLNGYNVLHPMGYDSFGLPAEQYAIQTGQHPAITTEQNIARYREQLDKIGFSFDWSRQVKTSDPDFYKWTQWMFGLLFKSWYNPATNKAEQLETLVSLFEKEGLKDGNPAILTGGEEAYLTPFTPLEWSEFSHKRQQEILMNFRLAYLSENYVNWCPALGTVLANDEVKDGYSERGGHPVERKLMTQWSLRITAYADRLLTDLQKIDWPQPLKDAQTNWIGKSEGCEIQFKIKNSKFKIDVFTTRPDTLFGVTFLSLAPEHELVESIATDECRQRVMNYVAAAKNRSERERMADVKRVSGEFTGAFAEHPFTGEKIQIWVADYVLGGYGTGAVMGVPAHDSRDFAFAKHFGLEVKEVILPVGLTPNPAPKERGTQGNDSPIGGQGAYEEKSGTCINSDFLDGLEVKAAISRCIEEVEKQGFGHGKTNYKLRDAIFGRQRYWGEPIPVYYQDGVPTLLPESELPLVLPEVDKYLPTEKGEPPLGRAKGWVFAPPSGAGGALELDTMPGYAGSSWYMFRYMDPQNQNAFAAKDKLNYWQQVDLYMGGSEHATGHLLYCRFWTKFLYDLGYLPVDEPAKKLINQGMIQGQSMIVKAAYGGLETIEQISESNKVSTSKYYLLEPNYELPEMYQMMTDLTDIDKEIKVRIISNDEFHYPIDFVKFENGVYFLDKEAVEKTQGKHPAFKYFYLPSFEDLEKVNQDWQQNEYFGTLPKLTDYKRTDNKITVTPLVEKMSKSKWNVVNPDEVIDQYGADTLRLYEMFLGPLEQSKPWNTQGIEGVHRFLKKLWNLFYDRDGNWLVQDTTPIPAELKVLHKTIKKATDDIGNFSFNTSVAAFMIAVNELNDLKCHKQSILADLLVIISPYAPHICEELWSKLAQPGSIVDANWPAFNPAFLVEDSFSYPISINGKTRTNIELPLNLLQPEVEERVLTNTEVQKWLEGKAPKKIIFVKGRIVNVVV